MAYTGSMYSSPYLGASPNTYNSPYRQAMQTAIGKRRMGLQRNPYAVGMGLRIPETPTTGFREPWWGDPEVQNPTPLTVTPPPPVDPLATVLSGGGTLNWPGPGLDYTLFARSGVPASAPGVDQNVLRVIAQLLAGARPREYGP